MKQAEATSPAALAVAGLTKSFPGTHALAEFSFDVRRGEVHAVVGENGAGKTTFLMLLSGVYQPDAGSITIDGRPVAFGGPSDAIAAGVGTVFQELSLVDGLSVAENVFTNRAPTRGPALIDRERMRRDAATLLRLLGSAIRPERRLGSLGVADRQVVEIAKALSLDARVLLLDEPTSALSAEETTALFSVIRRLTGQGMAVVFVSHRLAEVFEVSDRITVLRDGHKVAEYERGEADELRVIHAMVGRMISDLYPDRAEQIGEALVQLRGVRRRGVGPIDLDIHAGEVLALVGLRGSGRSRVARLVAGAERIDDGELLVAGRRVRFRQPWQAARSGIAYLPADRKGDALFGAMNLGENLVVSALGRVTRRGLVRRRAERELGKRLQREFDIRARSLGQPMNRLSGGNQQKAVLARWFATDPRLLVADEPTQGIDVGAKAEIHARLRSLAKSGMGVVIVTSDLPEALGMADRIAVMAHGRVQAVLDGAAATEQSIVEFAAGTAA